ncbi:hypothetical protein QUB80_22135 [Chlorogloeopsis sp. ULAP01]|uniref:hypothetical protein n=1 Tax=Chlorogloeopsis sp. ULAP01 TaxID=3056483 RepID=UPI0025AAE6A5|nr:hypothetical protein [Chlorogloeopsis sp. ULAP01]MDM9383395.1 hypothetical protein [Chlorogloeopsis sp. ULAP01]
MKKFLAFITTAIIACISIASITAAVVTWDSWVHTKTSIAVAQKTSACPADSNKRCLDIDVYEALNIIPREDRLLIEPALRASYNGNSSPPNPLVIYPGDSVYFFISPQYFLPASYELLVTDEQGQEKRVKYVPHVGAGKMWPLLYPGSSRPIYTNNKVTFNSGDSFNPQQVTKEFAHAGVTDDPPSPTSAQYLISSGPITYYNLGEFVATARVQMIRHFWTNCSPANWAFVPNTNDLCTPGQNPEVHSKSDEDKLIDITVSRLIKVAPPSFPIAPFPPNIPFQDLDRR